MRSYRKRTECRLREIRGILSYSRGLRKLSISENRPKLGLRRT